MDRDVEWGPPPITSRADSQGSIPENGSYSIQPIDSQTPLDSSGKRKRVRSSRPGRSSLDDMYRNATRVTDLIRGKADARVLVEIRAARDQSKRHVNVDSAKKEIVDRPFLLNTFEGVFIPCVASVLGTILFLRVPWIVAHAGIGGALGLLLLSFLVGILSLMSIAAISTNGDVPGGGPYYILSRTLGPYIGGSIGILYYFGLVALSALHSFGAGETLHLTFESFHVTTSLSWDLALFAWFFLVLVAFITYFGIKHVARVELAMLALVFTSIIAILIGVMIPPRENQLNILGPSWETFKENWGPQFEGETFFTLLGIMFPAMTGILAGLNRSADLKNSSWSIPRGTLIAVITTSFLYILMILFFGASVKREYLRDGKLVMAVAAWPLQPLIQFTVWFASFAESVQALLVAPRILQAIAADRLVPFLTIFSALWSGEPRRALFLSTILAIITVFLGNLETMAPFITMFLLLCFSFVNLSCFVLARDGSPNFRPRWKFFHWSTALLGFVTCIVMMFLIQWWWALVIGGLGVLFYKYLEFKGDESDWGDGVRGFRLQNALDSIVQVRHTQHTKNWRPQILCMVKLNAEGYPTHPEILSFTEQLKKGRGLTIVAAILIGQLESDYERISREKTVLENIMRDEGIQGFPTVIVSDSFHSGRRAIMQCAGLGPLRPNTIVLGWPTPGQENIRWGETLVQTLIDCERLEMAVLVCRGLENFPSSRSSLPMSGSLDLWWIIHDGGLELLIAFLLQKHDMWEQCNLRIFTVAEEHEDPERIRLNLRTLLYELRIEAEVKVILLSEENMMAFAHDHERLRQSRRRVINELNVSDSDASHDLDQVYDTSAFASFDLDSHSENTSSALNYSTDTSIRLNGLIRTHSKDSALVLLNLPSPVENQPFEEYMEYLEKIGYGIPRMVMIKGSGTELITVYN